jgi:plasmid stabilization system protein ParE
MRVRYSRRSLTQLAEILAYIAVDSPRAAAEFASRVETLVSLIGRHPAIGRPTDVPNVRVFGAKPYPYLVFYRIHGTLGSVTVLRVRHAARSENWRRGR